MSNGKRIAWLIPAVFILTAPAYGQRTSLLKEFESPPKVILLSGVYSKPSYRRQARNEYGADDLLPKPFDVASLLSIVKHHLNRDGDPI